MYDEAIQITIASTYLRHTIQQQKKKTFRSRDLTTVTFKFQDLSRLLQFCVVNFCAILGDDPCKHGLLQLSWQNYHNDIDNLFKSLLK